MIINRRTKYQRRIIDKAKNLVMKELSIPEHKAYYYLRKEAMNKRKSVYEIAEIYLFAYEE